MPERQWLVIDRITKREGGDRLIEYRVITDWPEERVEITGQCREGDSILITEPKKHHEKTHA